MSPLETRIAGMRDMFPEDHQYLTFLKKVFRHEFRKNSFRRISTPLLERTSLLKKIFPHMHSDDALFHFECVNGEDITLIPCKTVGIMRAYLESEKFLDPQPLYYYYMDRSYKKTEYNNELYIMGGQVIGESDPVIDAQNIYMTHTILHKIGIGDEYTLEINSYGNAKEMEKYKEELQNFYENKKHLLSQKTLDACGEQILRVFESQEEDEKILIQTTPDIGKFLRKDSKNDYTHCKQYLDDLGVKYIENRTFFYREDMYTGVIWRFKSDGGQVIASGGRHDILATLLGSAKPHASSSFHFDTLAIIEKLKEKNISIKNKDAIDLYFVQLGDEAKRAVFPLSLQARSCGINTQTSLGTPSMKEQMLKAQRLGARYVVLVGIMEARSGIFQVRNLEDGTQEEIKKEELIEYIISKIGKEKLDFYEPSRDLLHG